jgi:hypothetical protein
MRQEVEIRTWCIERAGNILCSISEDLVEQDDILLFAERLYEFVTAKDK